MARQASRGEKGSLSLVQQQLDQLKLDVWCASSPPTVKNDANRPQKMLGVISRLHERMSGQRNERDPEIAHGFLL